jgi:hypothetical protein
MGVPPAIAFIGMFHSAKEVFGKDMEPDFLIERVRSYGWKPSVTRLAQLAAYIQSAQRTDEEIRRRTIDPILSITGDARSSTLIACAHAFVRANRLRIRIAHEEVITYLQHLVLVEGGDSTDVPSDAELCFWMLGANCHLGEWAEPDSRELTADEHLIAVQVRGHTFNQSRHWLASSVRSHDLFRSCPEDESLGGHEAWLRIQQDTFGAPFEDYYRLILAPILAAARRAGDEDKVPAVSLDYWKTTGADPDWVRARLNAIAISRPEAARLILASENARAPNGLLHAPSLLRRRPLLVDDEGWLIISQAAIATQFHAGPWGAYLEKSKATHGDVTGFKRWSAAFGVAFERYCGELARAAATSSKFRRNWKLVMPTKPGSSDEIEDVIVIEDDHAILFSIKSTLLPEGSIHRAKSRSAVIDWLDRFLFSTEKSFRGALQKLSANVDEIRNGVFQQRGIPRALRILPVLITYDEIGDDVLLHQRIRRRCKELGIMTQSGVAPVTIGSIEEFEALMEYVAEGRSLVGLLRKRKQNKPWFGRRLDQQLGSLAPRIGFAMMKRRFQEIFDEVITAVRGPRRGEDDTSITAEPLSEGVGMARPNSDDTQSVE